MTDDILIDSLKIEAKESRSKTNFYFGSGEQAQNSGLGHLFIIIEIPSQQKSINQVIDDIIHELSNYYYSSATKDAESALESTCQFFNEHGLNITGFTKTLFAKINILLAVYQESFMVLASRGRNQAWLVRNNRMIDILEGSVKDAPEIKSSKKFFTQLSSGETKPGDIILLTTPSLLNFFSQDKIKQALIKLSPVQGVEFLKNSLEDSKPRVNFTSIVFKQATLPTQTVKPPEAAGSLGHSQLSGVDPLTDLVRLQEKTGKILKSSAWPNWINYLKSQIKSKKDKIENKEKTGVQLPIKSKKETSPPALQSELTPKIESQHRPEALATPKTRLSGPKQIKKFAQPQQLLLPNIKEFLDVLASKFRLLSSKKKFSSLSIFLVAVIFLASLFFLNYQRQRSAAAKNFDERSSLTQEKIDSAQAAIIYLDEKKSRELLLESNDLLAGLEPVTKKQQQEKELLEAAFYQTSREIFNVEQKNAAEITNLANLFQGDTFLPPQGLVAIENFLLTFVPAQNSVFKINLDDNSVSQNSPVGLPESPIQTAKYFEDGQIVLSHSDGQLGIYNVENETYESLNAFGLGEKIIALTTYGSRIYLISPTSNQIIKIEQEEENFSDPTNWLTDTDVDLASSISMAIDGNIYVAKASGEVIQLFKGLRTDFSLEKNELTPDSSTQIITSSGSPNLYLLQPIHKRIVIYNKQGEIIKQIELANIETPENFVINESINLAYLLANGKIYQVSLD